MSDRRGPSKNPARNCNKPIPLEGRYANFFEVGHNAFEFILDFGQYDPENASAYKHTRIVTGPVYAKLVAEMLTRAVRLYEEERGVIQAPDDDLDPLEMVKESIAGYDRSMNHSRKRRDE